MTGIKDRASTTAFIVASCLTKLARSPQWKSYFTENWLALNTPLVQHSRDSFTRRLIDVLPPSLATSVMDFLFIPGMMQHFLFRKLLIAEHVQRALESETRQVLVLGSGLDTLAIRLSKHYPEVTFFEVDRPGTLARKQQAMRSLGYEIPQNCKLCAGDLCTFPNGVGPFADLPTLVVLEGVLMYFSEPAVRTIFNALANSFSQLQILFGATVSSDEQQHWRARCVHSLLRRQQEGTHWYCPSESMPDFLHSLGYELRAWIPYKQLQSIFRPVAELENLPDEDENYYIVEKRRSPSTGQQVSDLRSVEFMKFGALRSPKY